MAIATYKKIASVTVGSGGAATIDFTNIPSTYTDLCLKLSARSAKSDSGLEYLLLKYNNSSAAQYNLRWLYANGSSALSETATADTRHVPAVGFEWSYFTANTFSNLELYIPNYAGSTQKSSSVDWVGENNATQNYYGLTAQLWANTAAINQITLSLNSGQNFVQHSSATLYGIVRSN